MSDDLPLSQQLEKMGFDKSTFMVVDKYEKVIVGDRRGNDFVENPAATFGNVYKQVDTGQYITTFEINGFIVKVWGRVKKVIKKISHQFVFVICISLK